MSRLAIIRTGRQAATALGATGSLPASALMRHDNHVHSKDRRYQFGQGHLLALDDRELIID